MHNCKYSFHNYNFNPNIFSEEIINIIEDEFNHGKLPLLDLDNLRREIDKNFALSLKNNFQNMIIIGMGGAILNPQMMLSVSLSKNIIFVDDLDEDNFLNIMSSLELKNTCVISISKSGETIETLALTLSLLEIYKNQSLVASNHFFFITNNNGSLAKIANEFNIQLIHHPQNIGGRFSGFTNVGMIPSVFANLNIDNIYHSAQKTLDDFFKKANDYPLYSGAFLLNNNNISVLLSYNKKIKSYSKWYAQIIAESLGKNSKGITPVRGNCPLDQHSQLQLYLDGPKDKNYTLFYVNNMDNNVLPELNSNSFPLLNNHDLNSVLNSEYKALKEIFIDNLLPLRCLEFNKFDENTIGSLMINSILEIIITSKILNVNPFDQPAVEKIKDRSNQILIGDM